MIKSAEEYAKLDQEKRKNIDLKNNAEALCYEVDKQFLLVNKGNVSSERQETIIKLIEDTKMNIQSENFEVLAQQIEELKLIMKELSEISNLNQNS